MSEPYTIVGIGEALWDLFPDGARFGGAPANFACISAQLGARSFLVSCLGKDQRGEEAITLLQESGVNTSHVSQCANFSTGTVEVKLDQAGKPNYTIGENVAWDHLEWSDDFLPLASGCDALCFGTLGQRSETSRRTIQRFVEAAPQARKVLDMNLRKPFLDEVVILESLALATILKLNEEELPLVASVCGMFGSETTIMSELSHRFHLELVAVTRGAWGAMILRGRELSECPGIPTLVRDTVGAGDAYTAALVMGLLEKHDLETINRNACQVSSYVCSQAGATPPLPEIFKSQLKT